MKIIEELKLKDTIEYISRFEAKHQTLNNIYQYVGELNLFSLQGMNYQFDKSFFDEISFVLSVIITIIKHPHIASYDIDEIIRADLAGHIENDSFQMVFKDPKLWKDKENEMIPEEVYYHEHVDEIKIYENIFIGMLINLIEQDLKKTHEFYISLLPTLSATKQLITNEEVKYAINKCEKELKKIRYIKETFFFKQIKKCNLNLRRIIPTNILLKDRLYNYCFKFYKKFIRYEDKETLHHDFTKYYFYLLLQQLKKRKAVLVKAVDNSLCLNLGGFEIEINKQDQLPLIKLNISAGGFNNEVNLICLFDHAEHTNLELPSGDGYIVDIWNLYNTDGERLNKMALSEQRLISLFLDNALLKAEADPEIYTKICPVCKNHSLSVENDIYECDHCGTKYVFVDDKHIWFLRTRGK